MNEQAPEHLFEYSYDSGFLIATDKQSGAVTTARMVKLRRLFAATGTLPAPFNSPTARRLIGCWKPKGSAGHGR